MDTTYGKLGLNITAAKQTIRQEPADMSIQQPDAELNIRAKPGKMDIDQSQAFAEANLKHIFQVIDDYAQKGRQAVYEGIARVTQQGDALMKIENGGSPIAEQARVNSEDPPLEFNIGWMPKSPFSVKFNYQPAQVNINWQTHKPNIEVKINKPEHTYTPGDINGYMRQWPSLTIEVIGLEVDKKV
jgi:hypothetical protein